MTDVLRALRLVPIVAVLVVAFSSPAWAQRASVKEIVNADPQAEGMSAERLRLISAWLKQEVDDGKAPGAVVVVARRGKIVYQESLGMLDKDRGTPMRPDAIFRIASMTKPIVSVATMMLVEEGKLKLGDPVSLHLPELKDLKVAKDQTFKTTETDPARSMTLHDLLRHSAGFTYWFIGPKGPIQTRYQDDDIRSEEHTSELQSP